MKNPSANVPSVKKPRKRPTLKQVLAWIAILLLVTLYALNLILALIGSEYTRSLLKGTLIMTFVIPILLYGMLVVMQGTARFGRKPEDDLTEEEKIGYYQMVEERDNARYHERKKAQEEKAAKKAARKARKK